MIISLALVGALGVAASPAGANEVIGQIGDPTGASSCSPAAGLVQTGVDSATQKYVASSSGVITSWSTFATAAAGQSMKLKVLRHQSGNVYSVVADSGFQPVAPSGAHPIEAHLPISAGDEIGLKMPSSGASGCLFNTGDTDDTYKAQMSGGPDPPAGSDMDFNGGQASGLRVNVSAVIEPDPDGDLFGNESQDLCPSVAGSGQGCLKADLAITNTVTQGVESAMVTSTSVARNNGPDAVPGAIVSAGLPIRSRMISAEGPLGPCTQHGDLPADCPLPTLASGESATVTIVGLVKAGFYFSQASVNSRPLSDAAADSHGAAGDTNTANNIASADLTVLGPVVSAASASAKTFRSGSALPGISRRRRAPRGTTFRFTLSQPASTTLAFTRKLPGRRVRGRCVRARRSNRKKARCTRRVAAGSLPAFGAHAGRNQVRFQGRLSAAKRLRPGRYTLTISGVDSFANQSRHPQTVDFTLLK